MKKAIQNTYIKNLHTPINKAQGNFQGFGKKFNKLPNHSLLGNMNDNLNESN
jgi:hypothetical protein